MFYMEKELLEIAKELKILAIHTNKIAKQFVSIDPTIQKRTSIKHRKPKIGSKFSKKFKGRIYHMTVIKSGNVLKYKVGRKVYKSPTAAARSITKYAINGWNFWGM